ncbi:MAG TPA: hypothetical protein VGX91_09130 [Candidatus Cybelea sp.]|jgi:hypothetical protein|nr:hypothetical protein [Candidatus Cybelea sp.]
MKHLRFVALAAALAACSGGSHGGAGSAGSATNPIAFPLFEGANVLSARQWHRTIVATPGTADRAVFEQGAGTYDGHDVVAGTQAFMPALEAWLGDLVASPPPGYTVAITGNGIDSVRTHTRELGFDFAAFTDTENGKRHGVVVMAIDPQTLDDKAGPMLQLIGRFKHMPALWRDPIDAQVRRQTGFSLSDASNPDTPVGAAISALDQLRDFGGRGIVLIDAVKQ